MRWQLRLRSAQRIVPPDKDTAEGTMIKRKARFSCVGLVQEYATKDLDLSKLLVSMSNYYTCTSVRSVLKNTIYVCTCVCIISQI